MRVVIERDGTLEIRPESASENYLLRKWFEDWQAKRVILRVSFKDDTGGYTKDEIVCPT